MTSPRLLLSEHHKALDAACFALRTCAFTDDALALTVRFRDLEHAVLLHMRVEEQELLPRYAEVAPADAALILAAHEEIRGQLYRLGVETELHCIRLESIDALIAMLREHAAHEDRVVYPWAEQNLSLGSRRSLFQSVGRSLRRLGKHPASAVAGVHT
jgi:hypothetical protein